MAAVEAGLTGWFASGKCSTKRGKKWESDPLVVFPSIFILCDWICFNFSWGFLFLWSGVMVIDKMESLNWIKRIWEAGDDFPAIIAASFDHHDEIGCLRNWVEHVVFYLIGYNTIKRICISNNSNDNSIKKSDFVNDYLFNILFASCF